MKAILTVALAVAAMTLSAQTRDTYNFPRTTSTDNLRVYATTLYTNSPKTVNTLRGDLVLKVKKDTIKSFDVSPTGAHYFVVQKEKGDFLKAGMYTTQLVDKKLRDFPAGKYGWPLTAVYTPDGRGIVVGTQNGVRLHELKKLNSILEFDYKGGWPKELFVSPNGYYLAVNKGKFVDIFSMEDGKRLHQLNIGEKVNDIIFSPDNTDMAVLTDDGVLTVYSTRTWDLRKMIDDLGDGLACAYNLDGKYVGVVTSPDEIVVVNMLNDRDRATYDLAGRGVSDIKFIRDNAYNTLMAYSLADAIQARRMYNLKPFYGRLISDGADKMMDEWLKMQPGETMEQYRERVNRESQARQRAKFEYEIATSLAGNPLAGMGMSIGAYDRANQILALDFDEMPTIYISVPEDEVTAFRNPADLHLEDVLYGVNPDDTFEIVYATVANAANGKSYIFDNLERRALDFISADDMISIEVLQQQQMEELRLQELREQVMQEAKNTNVISDHTNIAVNSRVVPDYDINGNKILNYEVSFTYEVDPGYSMQEDFGPGKYHIGESGAASSMMKIVKQAFEGDMRQYLENSKKLKVTLLGTADATPILRGLVYDGSYGDFEDEPVVVDGEMSALSVNTVDLMKENPQLAFVRALGVKDYLEKNVDGYNTPAKDYRYEVNVSKDKGSEFRRITATFTFVDAFKNL